MRDLDWVFKTQIENPSTTVTRDLYILLDVPLAPSVRKPVEVQTTGILILKFNISRQFYDVEDHVDMSPVGEEP